jgi:DNA-binding transcriptional LysR family regulator
MNITAILHCVDANHADTRWDDLRLLLAVARRGSFLGAGRAVGLATSTLSRRLTALERAVGTVLVERRADGARLTDAGRRLAAAAEDVELALGARLRELPVSGGRLSGSIRVTAGDGFAEFLAETIADFVTHHPDVSFDVQVDSRPVDLPRREADVAIRTLHGREGSLVYRSLGALPYGLFTAPAYAARRGVPRTLRELPSHVCVGLSAPFERVPWMRWLRANGVTRFGLRATGFAVLLAAVRAGIGIAPLPQGMAAGLVRVLPRVRPDPLPVWVASHVDARRLPAVRAFVDHLAARFRAGPAGHGREPASNAPR